MQWRRSSVLPYLEALRISPKFPWLLSSSVSYSDTPNKKPKLAPLQERKMVDRVRLWVKGGDGGNGCFSHHRSRHDRRGKPDGGNGGRGGDVILECSPTVWDFRNLQRHVKAERGGHGFSKKKIGSRGADKVVNVPVGTVIHLVHGEIPSIVENRSSKALDPWEIPSTLEDNPSDPDHKTAINIPSTVEILERKDFDGSFSCVERNTEKPSSMGFKKERSRVHNGGFVSNFKEGESEGEVVEVNDGMSEAECDEEEMEEEEEEEIQYNVAELTEPGQRVIVSQGGKGGLGNSSLEKKFTRGGEGCLGNSSLEEVSNTEDQLSVSSGSPSSEAVLVLELKSIADVGLVGMPNAGKSTLLGAISRAKPTVGHYAFTTLRPNIGNLNYDDFFSVTVADIPGIIKGAHVNRGLGHAFLRHIERTKVLAYVVDLAAALDGRKGIPPWEQLRDLVLELEHHQVGLSDRPSLVVANKIDEEGALDVYEELKRRVHGVPIFPICAILEEGVPELKAGLRLLVDGRESQKLELDGIMLD